MVDLQMMDILYSYNIWTNLCGIYFYYVNFSAFWVYNYLIAKEIIGKIILSLQIKIMPTHPKKLEETFTLCQFSSNREKIFIGR